MLEQYASVLKGKDVDLEGTDPSVPILFSNAPITSVDCERTFSKLKIVLADQRTRLTEAHVRDILLLQWNKDLLRNFIFVLNMFQLLSVSYNVVQLLSIFACLSCNKAPRKKLFAFFAVFFLYFI